MIDQYKQRHDRYLQQVLEQFDIPAQVIHNALHYCLFPGGKRIRPILVYLFGELLDVNLKAVDAIAAAIELTHSYSLIHDDLPAMDDDDLRRGKASCHKAFDEATAILVGDGLQAMALQIVLEQLPPLLAASQVIAVSLELLKASGLSGMVSGQSLDLTELNQAEAKETVLCKIHQLKTGKLISACVEMVLATQVLMEEEASRALRTYAYHIGFAFQIQDDYLDHYAPTSQLGKNRSSDLANQKTTFADLYPKKQLEEKINTHYQLAIGALHSFGEKNKPLIELTLQLQNRSHSI